jgi:hypothetical protein
MGWGGAEAKPAVITSLPVERYDDDHQLCEMHVLARAASRALERLAAGPLEVPELTAAGAVPPEATSDLEPRHRREQGLVATAACLHVLGVRP